MEIIKGISYMDMLHRWALGEAKSKRFINPSAKQNLILLNSKNPNEVLEGINNQLNPRAVLINNLPLDTKWYLVFMPINEVEFLKVFTIKASDWDRFTNETYKLSDAVNYLIKNPKESEKITYGFKKVPKIDDAFQIGITFLTKSIYGPFTVIEGNSRMVNLYYHYIIKKRLPDIERVELVVGITEKKYIFSYIHN